MQSQMKPATSGTQRFSMTNEIVIAAMGVILAPSQIGLAHNATVNQTLHAGSSRRSASMGEVSG